jgi:hypothetical protein
MKPREQNFLESIIQVTEKVSFQMIWTNLFSIILQYFFKEVNQYLNHFSLFVMNP